MTTKFQTIALLLMLLLCDLSIAYAQKHLDCPKPHKQQSFRLPTIKNYLLVSAEIAYPFAYKIGGNYDKQVLKSASGLGGGIVIQDYHRLTEQILINGGITFSIVQHGFRFNNGKDGNTYLVEELMTNGLLRLSLGLSYRLSPSWQIDVSPEAVYNTNLSYSYKTGVYSSNNNGTVNGTSVVDIVESSSNWLMGAKASLNYSFTQRFMLGIFSTIDFAPSAIQKGSYTIMQNGIENSYTFDRRPYLINFGISMGYKVWTKGEGI